MLPPIPTVPWRIDSITCREHHYLESSDLCYYLWEYTRRGGFAASPSNSLIANLKKKPSCAALDPVQWVHKQNAIGYAAHAIRSLINRRWLEGPATLVPMPCSKIDGHPDHDDRLVSVLRRACDGYQADICPLLMQVASTEADHEACIRQQYHELEAIMRVNEAAVRAPRSQIMLFDDVLSSGKHFKVAQRLLRARFPEAKVFGLFLARCLP